MANISLKDIQFPGLNNVYKVPEVDNTLTQSGEAADAKKTGDEITSLKQDFNQTLKDMENCELIQFSDPTKKKCIDTSGSTTNLQPETSIYNVKYAIVDVSPGDKITINGSSSSPYYRLWAFVNANNGIISKSTSPLTANDLVLVAPENAVKLVINDYSDSLSYKGTYLKDKVAQVENTVNEYINKSNILNNFGTAITPNKYYYNGVYTINEDYSVFSFPVSTGDVITFGCRVRFLCSSEGNIGTSYSAGDTYTATNYTTLYATVFNADKRDWIFVKSPDIIADSAPYGRLSFYPNVEYLPKLYEQYKGDAQSGTLGTANSIKKNKVINFGCDFSTFGTLNINLIFGTGNTVENKFAIDSTNLTRTVDGSVKPSVAHGITIADHINVTIEILITGLKITIVSNGQSYSSEFNYANGTIRPSYDVSGMTISNVDFSWTCKDFKKDIWMFGDSYFSYGDNRWIYYLSEDGYTDNCLIDAYPGEGSNYSLPSLQSYIDMAKPKYIVWCVGMNDGSDTSAPSTQWMNAVNEVIAICKKYNIVPIFGTIPTVPSINHEKKNAWIRSSSYQYIDFAKAVGASSSGVWFSGMLSTDNVHPTSAGAMALYRQALLDCPQLMVGR